MYVYRWGHFYARTTLTVKLQINAVSVIIFQKRTNFKNREHDGTASSQEGLCAQD